MYWLLGSKLQLSIENKLLLYKTILKPIWAYGVQLWASNSNIEILQRFQNKSLSTHFGTSPMTLYIMILTYHTLERLKNSVRDTPIGTFILTINLMREIKTPIKKKTISKVMYLIIL